MHAAEWPPSARSIKFWRIRFPPVTRHRGIRASCVRAQELVWNLMLSVSIKWPIPPHEQSQVASDVLDVSRPSNGDRTFLHGLVSLAAAAGIALLLPLAMLLVGLPVVFAVRGVLEVIGWIVGVALR